MAKFFSFSRRRKYQTAVKRTAIAGVFILSFLYIFIRYPSEMAFSNIKEQGQYALQQTLHVVSYPVRKIGDMFTWIGDVSNIREENAELHRTVRSLEKELNDQKNIIQENRALKKQINLAKDYPYNYITARVFFDTTTSYFKTLLINAGRLEGVKKYQAVLANGYLVGQIIEVFDNSARVLLLTDSNVKIPVINTRTRVRAFLKGDNTTGGVMYHLEKKDPVMSGDQITTSGFDGMYPAGIPVGMVKKVSSAGRILVDLFGKKNDIEFVQVLDFKGMKDEKK